MTKQAANHEPMDDSGESMDPVAVAIIAESATVTDLTGQLHSVATNANCVAIPRDLNSPFLGQAHILIIEIRTVGGLDDLKLVTQIRLARPLIPIIAISAVSDQEFLLMAYQQGVNEVLAVDTNPELLWAKIRSFNMFTSSAAELELKNNEVVHQMADLRGVKSDLADEKHNRQVAEERQKAAEKEMAHYRQVQEIMDSFQDGFFYVDDTCTIADVVSAKCRKIFGQEIVGKGLSSVLSFDENKGAFIEYCAFQIFDDILPLSASMSMLPKQVKMGERELAMDYRVSRNAGGKIDKIIFVIKDITKEMQLARQNQERQISDRCLINILKSKEQFLMFLEDFRSEIAELAAGCDIPTALKILHTIKGNAGSFGLEALAHFTHSCETSVLGLPEAEALAMVPPYAASLADILKTFLEDNHSVLGIGYNEASFRTYTIDDTALAVFKNIARRAPDAIANSLDEAIYQLTHKPISLLVNSYAQSTARLAKNLKKELKLQIEGEGIRVDFERHAVVFRNLIHALNNAIDHGIEDLPTRTIRGKPRQGILALSFRKDDDDALVIEIKDDGNGIDRQRLARLAVDRGLFSQEEINQMPPEELDGLIFHQGLSSQSKASQTSGRGVGMAALKEAAEYLGGTIKVYSQPLKGTHVAITIPTNGRPPHHAVKVLVVEDEEDLRYLYRNILDELGYEVTECDNGLDALLQLSKATYDLVITDLRMPGMEGEVLVDKIREVRSDSLPILVVSGYLNPHTHRKLSNQQGVKILAKGGRISDIKAKIIEMADPIALKDKKGKTPKVA